MSDEHRRPRFIVHRSSFIVLLIVVACTPPEKSSVRDDLNRPLTLPSRVTRVITLAPNLTEMVYAIGSGDRLVGTDEFSDEPAPAKSLPKVGGMQPSIEKIVALRPDLVLATTNGNHPNLAPALASVHVPLFVVRTDRLDDVPRSMARISAILGSRQSDAAAKLRAAILRQKRTRSHPPRVLFAVWADPLFVAGTNTFSDDLLRLTGAVNVVRQSGWPQYSLESLVESPPDLILYPAKSVSGAQVEKVLAVAPSLRDRVQAIPVDENLFTRPGPRVAEAAAAMNQIFDRRSQ